MQTCGTKHAVQATDMSSPFIQSFLAWHLDWLTSWICRHWLPVKINHVNLNSQSEIIEWLFQGKCLFKLHTEFVYRQFHSDFSFANGSGSGAKAALWVSWSWSAYFSLFWAPSHVFVPQDHIKNCIVCPCVSFTPFWTTKYLVFNTRPLAVQPAHSLHSCTDLLKSSGRLVDSQPFSQQMSFCGLDTSF